ncbi:MAG: hypothetical protein ABID54_01780, partial [Pseudomonadota bacterium]
MVNKQKLEKQVENRAREFRSRGHTSPSDLKRHDQVRPDERKWIGIAHDELDWSYAKIGSVFSRNARTVKVSVEKERKILTRRKEDQNKKEQHTERVLIQQQQKEHIKILQQMARSALDHLPDLPDLQNEPGAFDSFNEAVVKVYRRLTADVDDWKNMAEHLGDKGNEIEMMSSVLDDVLPGGSLVRPRLDEYKRNLEKAWFLIKFGGLKTISESSDTRKWE